MIPDHDELQRRRAERLAKKKQRKKKMLLRIAAVVGIVALIVGMVFLVKGCVDNKKRKKEAEESPKTVIKLAAAGDLNINDATVAAGGEAMDYTAAFQDVLHLLGDADITVMNFEGNVVGAPYGTEDRSAPPQLLTSLDEAGVDLLQLANSYSIYNGTAGLTRTIDSVRAAGLEPLGAYATEDDFKNSGGYTIVEVQGIRIAFVAFTKGMDGMTMPKGSENCVNLLYEDYDSTYNNVDSEKINKILDAVDREKPDLVVTMLHWGSEFNDTISTSQNQILELLRSRGVDAILGTHSHYVQKIDYDRSSGQFLAYSLGDFFSDAQRSGTEYSIILELEITKDETTGETKITNYSYTPIFTVAEEGKPLRVVRIAEAMLAYENGFINAVNEQTYNKMKYALQRIEARIKG